MTYNELGADQIPARYGEVIKEGVEDGVRKIVEYTVIVGTVLLIGSFFLKGKLVKKIERNLL